MKRIINYLRILLTQGKLSEAIDKARLYPPGYIIYESVLVDHLNDTIIENHPDLEYDLRIGYWYRARGSYNDLTLKHSRVDCQVVIAE